jgi:AAHS family 4-hydroxybenzoate transporter-like MFS transporter
LSLPARQDGSAFSDATLPAAGTLFGWQRVAFAVVTLCALVAFLDGFDTQAMGPAGAAIAHALGLPISALGSVFGVSQLGFLIGTLLCAPLGDRFGRKYLLTLATCLFALSSLGTALAGSYAQLLGWRMLAGFGLGGATPNFISLASEFSNPAFRARIVTILWAAVPLGGMVGSFASAFSLPVFGWRAVFFAGCVAPVLLAPVIWFKIPSRGIAATEAPDAAFGLVLKLFEPQRALRTILLWLASFMTWMVLIVATFWTPPLLKLAGFSASSSAAVLAFSNFGGVVGTLAIGSSIGRFRPHQALLIALPATGCFLLLLSMATQIVHGAFVSVALAAICAGFFESAAGGALLGLSADIYPAALCATGVGWALGIGRIGSIMGPLAAGGLVAAHWSAPHILAAIALPAFGACIFVLLLSKQLRIV